MQVTSTIIPNFAFFFHSRDRKQAPTSHRKSQSVYIPPAKRSDTRSDLMITQSTEEGDRENVTRERGEGDTEGMAEVELVIDIEPITNQIMSKIHQNMI